MRDPNTSEDWQSVARERAADAQALLAERDKSVGPVYLAGYAIECFLKAYLKHRDRKFPKSGRSGHNLSALWKQAGFTFKDLNDSDGNKVWFIKEWDVALRYQNTIDVLPRSSNELVKAAKCITSHIVNAHRRSRKRRR